MNGGERDPDGNGSVAEVTRSQPVLTPLTESAILLVLTVETGGVDAMRDLLAGFAGIRRSVGFRDRGRAQGATTAATQAACSTPPNRWPA
jgi:hypothetical protein